MSRRLNGPNTALEQLRSTLAARIVKALAVRTLTVSQAQAATGIAAADFSRIRNARLARFTVDRLMTVLLRMGYEVEVTVTDLPPRSVSDCGGGAALSEDEVPGNQEP